MTRRPTGAVYRFMLASIAVGGACGAVVFCCHALKDWAELQRAYAHFEQVATSSPEMTELFTADAMQNIHRINVFAEGVWTLLSAIVAAIGLHGFAMTRSVGDVVTPRQ